MIESREIDRLAPTHRPPGRPAGYQRWRSLLFLHWRVPVEPLRQFVPAALELDLWEGEAYVGVVPFAMEGIRPAWYPEALALRFLETNVRTYVTCRGRPGVYFFSLDANSLLAVQAARVGWRLPYYHAAMQMHDAGGAIAYSTRRRRCGARHEVRYQVGEMLGPSAPGTLEHFFLERYLLFVERKGRIEFGQVHHPPYPAQMASVDGVQDELVAAAGLPPVRGLPDFAHFARGVDVEVYGLKPVTLP